MIYCMFSVIYWLAKSVRNLTGRFCELCAHSQQLVKLVICRTRLGVATYGHHIRPYTQFPILGNSKRKIEVTASYKNDNIIHTKVPHRRSVFSSQSLIIASIFSRASVVFTCKHVYNNMLMGNAGYDHVFFHVYVLWKKICTPWKRECGKNKKSKNNIVSR
jgi:hypothetical protein